MRHLDYVIVRGQVFRWEEKAPFVPSGVSIKGALEYDPASHAVKCHECGAMRRALEGHVLVHGIASKEYKIRHGLLRKRGLCTPEIREARAKRCVQRGVPTGFHFVHGRTARGWAGSPTSEERKNERMQCRAQLIAKIRRIFEELGRAPTQREVGKVTAEAAKRTFDGWLSALQAADVPAPSSSSWTVPVLIELVRDFYVLNRRLPRRADFQSGSLPSYKICRQKHKDISAARANEKARERRRRRLQRGEAA